MSQEVVSPGLSPTEKPQLTLPLKGTVDTTLSLLESHPAAIPILAMFANDNLKPNFPSYSKHLRQHEPRVNAALRQLGREFYTALSQPGMTRDQLLPPLLDYLGRQNISTQPARPQLARGIIRAASYAFAQEPGKNHPKAATGRILAALGLTAASATGIAIALSHPQPPENTPTPQATEATTLIPESSPFPNFTPEPLLFQPENLPAQFAEATQQVETNFDSLTPEYPQLKVVDTQEAGQYNYPVSPETPVVVELSSFTVGDVVMISAVVYNGNYAGDLNANNTLEVTFQAGDLVTLNSFADTSQAREYLQTIQNRHTLQPLYDLSNLVSEVREDGAIYGPGPTDLTQFSHDGFQRVIDSL